MELTELQKKKIREICWRAVKGIDLNINDRKVIEETADEFETVMEALASTNVTSANSIAQLGAK